MFHDNEPESVVVPSIWAESEDGGDSLATAIADHERSQRSTGETEPMNPGADPDPRSFSKEHGTSRNPAPAERRFTEQELSDQAFSKTFLDAIEESTPIMTPEKRAELDAARERELENGEENETEELDEIEEAPEEDEESLGENPLNAFPEDVVQALLEKHGLSPEDAQDPRIANMLAAQLTQQQAQQTQDAIQQRQPQSEQEHYQAYMSELQRVASDPQINDPVMMAAFENTLAHCFGADTPEAKANVKNLGSALVQGGLSLMSTVVPAMMNHYFAQALEATLPGLAQNHFDAIAHNAWADVRQDPAFRDLPEVDSPEFNELREKVLQANPWMTKIQFQDERGTRLHPDHPKAIRQQAALFARLATGERLSPEAIQKAVERGRQQAESHTRRVTASRSLGSGRRSPGNSFGHVPRNDFLDAIKDYNRSQRSTEYGGE